LNIFNKENFGNFFHNLVCCYYFTKNENFKIQNKNITKLNKEHFLKKLKN